MVAKQVSRCMSHVREAFENHRAELGASNLAPATKGTCLRHAETFYRWIEGDFEPGAEASRYRRGSAR